jgi:hypothetical protein
MILPLMLLLGGRRPPAPEKGGKGEVDEEETEARGGKAVRLVVSGSSIQAKEDWASVERVGMGPCGRCCCCCSVGAVGAAAVADGGGESGSTSGGIGGEEGRSGGGGGGGGGGELVISDLRGGRMSSCSWWSVSILSSASGIVGSAWISVGRGGAWDRLDLTDSGDDSAVRVSSTAEEIMTTGVVSSATVGDLISVGLDMASLLIAGSSSSGRARDESSKQALTNWTLAAASSIVSTSFSFSPSKPEAARSLRLVIDSSSMAAS